MSKVTIRDFFEHEECSLQRLRIDLTFPNANPALENRTYGYFNYFKPYLAYSDDEHPGGDFDMADEMILNHPCGLVRLTFHCYDDALERLHIQVWSGPRTYLDELLRQWIQDCLRLKVENFLSPFNTLLDSTFKPDLQALLMEHPF